MTQHYKPDFVVVGAAKSGTTSLFHWLNQHPHIFLPDIKESRYFSQQARDFVGLGAETYYNSGITSASRYQELYDTQEHLCCGEVSNDYLYYHESSIQNLLAQVGPQVKIIMVLREPLARAWSNHQHNVREGSESLDFDSALQMESERIHQHWAWPYHYMKAGHYHDAVQAYQKAFIDVKVVLFEELQEPNALMAELFKFLDCSPIEIETEKKHNEGGLPRFRFWHQCLGWPQRLAPRALKKMVRRIPLKPWLRTLKKRNLRHAPMPKSIRGTWQHHFDEDIRRLSERIDRDLTHWLKA